LAQYVADYYQLPWQEFDESLRALQNLRTQATAAAVEDDGLRLLQRYFGQLEYVLIKFPLQPGRVVVPFSWYANKQRLEGLYYDSQLSILA
jgi:hypothetical protein